MFAYCGNNPINYTDAIGLAPEYHGDPQYQWAWDFGFWLKDVLEEKQEGDRQKIESGEVSYKSNGPGNGARIENSYEITSIPVMIEFVNENRGDEIDGSTAGVVFEWVIHNGAHAIGKALGIKSFEDKGKHVDVGNTIYADQRDDPLEAFLSTGMKVVYFITNPFAAIADLFA